MKNLSLIFLLIMPVLIIAGSIALFLRGMVLAGIVVGIAGLGLFLFNIMLALWVWRGALIHE